MDLKAIGLQSLLVIRARPDLNMSLCFQVLSSLHPQSPFISVLWHLVCKSPVCLTPLYVSHCPLFPRQGTAFQTQCVLANLNGPNMKDVGKAMQVKEALAGTTYC